MSTKTTFKRIALVAVAALGFGTLSVVPSSAANLPLAQEAAFRTGTFLSAPATATIGTPVSATFRITGSCLLDGTFAYSTNVDSFFFDVKASYTTQLDVAPVGTNLLTNSVDVDPTVPTGYTNSNANTLRYAADANNGFRNTLQGECLGNATPLTAYGSVTFTPDVAGTYVIVALPLGATTPAATWTVVASARAAVSAAASTSVLAGVGAVGTNWFGAGEVISAPRTVVAPVANATVTVGLGNGNTSGSPLRAQDTVGLTATISGPGTLSWDTAPTNYGRAIARTTGGLTQVLNIYADGNAGVSTVTISHGTTIISTETITFFGAPATVVATAVNPVVAATGGSATGAVSATVKDANGNPVAGIRLYATSDTPTVISDSYTMSTALTDATGTASFTLTPVALGTAKITVGSGSSAAAVGAVNAAPVTVRSGSTTVAGIKFSLDSTDYSPGQAAVLTVSFTDAAGLPVANHSTLNTLMTSNIVSSIALTGAALPAVSGQSLAITNNAGTVTLPINMPITSGPVTISAGTLIAGVAGTASVTANVSNSEIAAAQDAAAEATDAANAATDAANAAAEAADAATAAAQDAADAVAALSTEVAAMITALKKQITALTNLVIKIQKKVKA